MGLTGHKACKQGCQLFSDVLSQITGFRGLGFGLSCRVLSVPFRKDNASNQSQLLRDQEALVWDFDYAPHSVSC